MSDAQDIPGSPARMSLLDKLIRFCLENKLVVGLFILFAVVWGIMVAPFDWDIGGLPRNPVPVDAIPDIGENQQIVFTEWMGRSPQDVEDQISYPMTVSLLGIPGIKTIRTYSFFGFSSIYIIFNEKIDFYWSRSRVLEKLNSLPAGTLPMGVQPTLGPDATSLGQIFWYTLEGRDPDGNPVGGWDLHELRTIQDWYVRYFLLAAEGISEVASVGGFVQEYQIDVDPDAMRAHGVTLDQVFMAVRMSNVDVGARTIEVNKVEYIIRGLGFIEQVSDIEKSVIKVTDNVPIYIKDVGKVALGPALRRGALDKEGAEAVGGVVVVRYGYNPLAAIKNVKEKMAEIAPGLRTKAVIDFKKTTRAEVEEFAEEHGFEAFSRTEVNHDAWLKWLSSVARGRWPDWITTSHVTIVPFYDRSGLIYETLGTLSSSLTEEILVTIIVVIVSVLHLRSSVLISGALPLAVLICFIAMKLFGVDANIVALSGIVIAIGTIVDMGIIVCENILRHLDAASPDEDKLEVIFRAAREVGGAVVTAVSTTVVSFLPVFAMIGAEGKLFKPLAFTKTFALIASVIVALTIIPAGAHLLFTGKISSKRLKQILLGGLVAAGVVVGFLLTWWAGVILALLGAYHLLSNYLPPRVRKFGPWVANAVAVLFVAILLTQHWLPLGPEKGMLRNFVFVAVLIGGLLGFFQVFQRMYGPILRWCLAHKVIFLTIPLVLVVFGVNVWWGLDWFLGPIESVRVDSFANRQDMGKLVRSRLLEERKKELFWTRSALKLESEEFRSALDRLEIEDLEVVFDEWSKKDKRVSADVFAGPEEIGKLIEDGILVGRVKFLLWTSAALAMKPKEFQEKLDELQIGNLEDILKKWSASKDFTELQTKKWGKRGDRDPKLIRNKSFATKMKWTLAKGWDGLGKEFMPPLDEGSYLYMPSTMPHASIGEAMDVLQKQDMALRSIPEIDSVVGKIGRAETPLDPAPISMIETVINYKPEYITDKDGHRIRYRYDKKNNEFVRKDGELIPDPAGRTYRQWRDHIKSPDDIWKEIVKAAQIPGSTSAPKLQPIAARIVMLQSGMRAPMGVKVKGPDLETIERVGLDIERFLKEVPSVEPATVIADRIVGKPYLEIDIDREAIARYGIRIRQVQDVIEVAIGGKRITTTVEGRERFPVRVRYMRELRDQIETLDRILVPAPDGTQIPLVQLADILYVRGPQVIKSEDTFLVGYVVFDMKAGHAEVDVVEECQDYLQQKIDSGELIIPAGVSYKFAGSYENQLRAKKTLSVVLPLALFVIFLILYFQFKSVPTSLLVFSGIIVAWAGGFLLIWFYGQPWFMDFSIFGVDMRELFQIHTINMSVAVWVGFLALFGIASDNGVVIATYLDQSFAARTIEDIEDIREATVTGAVRRIRPCLMTSATTILALIPVLTSTGRGSDVMVPMAIPSFGGMLVVLVSVFVVPVLYCAIKEIKFKLSGGARA